MPREIQDIKNVSLFILKRKGMQSAKANWEILNSSLRFADARMLPVRVSLAMRRIPRDCATTGEEERDALGRWREGYMVEGERLMENSCTHQAQQEDFDCQVQGTWVFALGCFG
jgi:hypothetical protein